MENWDVHWDKLLNETANLAFNPDWSLVFKNCPYTIQVRASLKKEFYKKRSEELRNRFRQEIIHIDLNPHFKNFENYLGTRDGSFQQESFKGRKEWLATLLSEANIDCLSREELIDIIHYSWATASWTDHPYFAIDVLKRNSLSKIVKELKKLLYGTERMEKRFDNFKVKIEILGAPYISEILAFTLSEECVLWNRVSADASIYLGINQLLPREIWKCPMSLIGNNYVKCCETLKIVRDKMHNFGFERADFVDIYHFMFFVYNGFKKQPSVWDQIRSFSKD